MEAKISEKYLEDWICDNWDSLSFKLSLGGFIGRQVVLPNGICDLLSENGIPIIIELKIGKLKERDVGQVLRYAGDVRRYLRGYATHHNHFQDSFETSIERAQGQFDKIVKTGHQAPLPMIGTLDYYYPISKTIIGQSIDERVLASAEAADVEVYLYEYHSDTDTFTFKQVRGDFEYSEPFPNWVAKMSSGIIDYAVFNAEKTAGEFYSGLFNVEVLDE